MLGCGSWNLPKSWVLGPESMILGSQILSPYFRLCIYFTPCHLFQSDFLPMEVSIGPTFFNLYQCSHLPKQPFIVKAWSFTKSKLGHNLQLKPEFVKDFITDISSIILLKTYWRKTQLYWTFPLKFIVEAWSFTKNRFLHTLCHCHL